MEQFESQKLISQLFGALKSYFLQCEPFSYGSFRTTEQNPLYFSYVWNVSIVIWRLKRTGSIACTEWWRKRATRFSSTHERWWTGSSWKPDATSSSRPPTNRMWPGIFWSGFLPSAVQKQCKYSRFLRAYATSSKCVFTAQRHPN